MENPELCHESDAITAVLDAQADSAHKDPYTVSVVLSGQPSHLSLLPPFDILEGALWVAISDGNRAGACADELRDTVDKEIALLCRPVDQLGIKGDLSIPIRALGRRTMDEFDAALVVERQRDSGQRAAR